MAAPAITDPQRLEVLAPELRHAIGHFATGVAVVSSRGDDGGPVGTTANALTSLSLKPPLLLICLDQSSSTLQAIRGCRAFTVNVLATEQRELSANFARRGTDASWDDVEHEPGCTGSPRLAGAVAALDCAVENVFPGGDHEIVIGLVCEVRTNSEPVSPLLYWRGQYTSLKGP